MLIACARSATGTGKFAPSRPYLVDGAKDERRPHRDANRGTINTPTSVVMDVADDSDNLGMRHAQRCCATGSARVCKRYRNRDTQETIVAPHRLALSLPFVALLTFGCSSRAPRLKPTEEDLTTY